MIGDFAPRLVFLAVVGTLAIALVLILRVPLRRTCGARVAYAAWTLVPLLALAVLLPVRALAPAVVVLDEPASALDMLRTTVDVAVNAAPAAEVWLSAAWLAGALATAVLFAWRQRRFVRALGPLQHVEDDVYRARTRHAGPVLVGMRRPRIVLPADYATRYDTRELALVLAHERTHLQRGDAWINALVAVVRSLCWFNPIVHVAAGRFRFDQELACDAHVIARFPEARRSYADAMLKTQPTAPGLPVGCHWQSSHPLKERILMLKQPSPGPLRRAAGLALVAALCVGGNYVAWAAQPLSPAGAAADRFYIRTADATSDRLIHARLAQEAHDPAVVLDADVEAYALQLLLSLDGQEPRAMTLVVPEGQTAAIASGDDDARVDVTFEVRPTPEGQLELVSIAHRGTALVGNATLRLDRGRTGQIDFADQNGQPIGRLYATIDQLLPGLAVTRTLETVETP